MNRIALLPSDVSQKIAAGEVIERPFSVIKELVENSLDAQAAEIKVELEEGGKRLLRVTDNGCGMSRDDALLAFERHSTSKISTEDDLDHIRTLGFRGEALPSISAVSRVTLKTAEKEGSSGTQIEREGEDVLGVEDIAFPKGTSIEVADLFFNLPARKKFLRSERSEMGQVVKYLTQAALASPEVRFSLFHGKRKVFDYPSVTLLKERIFQIFRGDVLDRLLEVNNQDGQLALFGYASRPPTGRRDRKQQFFYVNNRPVKDKIFQAALNQSYKSFLEKDHSPESFLFLRVPFTDVDVNVHPTKTEVKFIDSNRIFRFVNRSVEQALLKAMGVKEIYPLQKEKEHEYIVSEFQKSSMSFDFKKQRQDEQTLFPHVESEEIKTTPVLGQYCNMYIIAAGEENLLIIDQHNAHERVLFDRYAEIDSKKKWPQKLALLPIVFDLSPSQTESLNSGRELLEGLGFRLEEMGGRSYALKEYPGIFREDEAKDIFLSLLEDIQKEKIEDKKHKLLATLSCKTAIKAGEVLTREKMEYLVDELFKTSNISLCPHGRPIIVKIQKGEIEKGLKRAKN
ncbi:DNA mismatch repair endonuclease MutL [Acidobacteriota bacterium]